jgi:hypothetical protein
VVVVVVVVVVEQLDKHGLAVLWDARGRQRRGGRGGRRREKTNALAETVRGEGRVEGGARRGLEGHGVLCVRGCVCMICYRGCQEGRGCRRGGGGCGYHSK